MNLKRNKGFSLIEVLVGIAIVITATTIVLSIIVSSFRISSKTTANSVVRQNGNYVLSQMSRTIQFGDSFSGAEDASGTIDSVCPESGDTYQAVIIKYNGTDKRLSCTGIQSGISTKITVVSGTCSFTCKQTPGEGPVIGINFDLAINSGQVAERASRVNFSTTVKMRNQ